MQPPSDGDAGSGAGPAAAAAAETPAGSNDEAGRAREAHLLAFHAARPGLTAQVLGRAGSYGRLADAVAAAASGPDRRVLDLACGDAVLIGELAARGCQPIGVDFSAAELAAGRARGAAGLVRARAQQLPFADASFAGACSHLAFMLFEDIARVVDELARVLAPGAQLSALLGGGPTAGPPTAPEDAFHRCLRASMDALRGATAFGDPRTRSETGWRTLFDATRWTDLSFTRWELTLDGPFDDVWQVLAGSYESARLDAACEARARAATADLTRPDGTLPCTMVAWLGVAVRR